MRRENFVEIRENTHRYLVTTPDAPRRPQVPCVLHQCVGLRRPTAEPDPQHPLAVDRARPDTPGGRTPAHLTNRFPKSNVDPACLPSGRTSPQLHEDSRLGLSPHFFTYQLLRPIIQIFTPPNPSALTLFLSRNSPTCSNLSQPK